MQTLNLKKAKDILHKTNQKYLFSTLKANRKATSLSPVKLNSEKHYFMNQQTKSHHKIKEKTLVIDLDETLVHSSFEYFNTPDIILPVEFEGEKCDVYVSVRPGAKEFISELAKVYEIVIFTASMSKYAEPLMALLDEKKAVSYHLFREHCTMQEGLYIKDLSQMGKELRNIVLIDNSIVSFAFQHENGIPIKSWFDDYTDIELYKFIPILKNLSGFYDIRTEIPKFVKNNTFIWMKAIKWFKENLLNINYQIDLDQVLRLEKSTLTITDSENIKQSNQNAIELRNSSNNNTTPVTMSHMHSKHKPRHKNQRAKNITNNNTNNSNDFIKITNNFFYDKTSVVKPQDEDPNTLYYCERVLTEVDLDNTIEQEQEQEQEGNDNNYNSPISIQRMNNNDYNNNQHGNININDNEPYAANTDINTNSISNTKLRRSSSLNKRKSNLKKEDITKKPFLYSMKGLVLKRDSKNNILHTSVEEKGETPQSTFYNIFKKFPKFNPFVKAKNKNKSSIESISSFPQQKFNSNINYNSNNNAMLSNCNNTLNNYNYNTNFNNAHLNYKMSKGVIKETGGLNYVNLKKNPHQHYPSCSINIQLAKNGIGNNTKFKNGN